MRRRGQSLTAGVSDCPLLPVPLLPSTREPMGENQSAKPMPPLVLDYGDPGAARSSRSWGGFIAQAVLGFTIGVGMCIGLIFLLVGYHQQFAENTGQFGRSVLSPAHLFMARGIVVAVLASTVAGAVGLWRRGR